MSIDEFLNKINEFILNPIIYLAFAVAMLIFFFGIFQFVRSETSDKERDKGKKKIFWGLVGMFVMFSAFGLIRLILGTFGIQPNPYPGF
jgi:uncharacterized membrane protein